MKEYKSPTSIVWLLGRMYCTGTPEDYAAVHALQDEIKLVPLSSYGKPYTPPPGVVDPEIDMKTPVREQVNRMDAVEFFTLLAELMKANPPAPADAPEVAKFAAIGLVPGQDFDASKLKADFVKRIPQFAFDRIKLQFKINREIKDVNGWYYTLKTGVYGTDYLMRAFITAAGLGANRPRDAIYPTSPKDAEGHAYDGADKYVVHFPRASCRPRKASGRSPCMTPNSSSSRTRSTAIRSARGRTSSATPTGRSTFTCSTSRPAPTRNRTGCLLRRTSSS